MRLTVSLIPESAFKKELKFPVALNDNVPEEVAQVNLRTSRFGDRVMVEGRAMSVVPLNCSRCLNTFTFPVKVSFKTEYIPYRGSVRENEHELTCRELDVNFYKDDEIDIKSLVREQMLLAIPMKPLCNTDCRGICPKCGKNLNEVACECSTDEIDPRLAPLKKIKKI